MTAKEMFEELGYKFRESTFVINRNDYFYYENTRKDKLICFYLNKKEVLTSQYKESMIMDIATLKAINKQCEELGWLE